MAAMKPMEVACRACGQPIQLPARLVIDPERPVAQILLSLDPAREHAHQHEEALPAALEHFGILWVPTGR